MLNLLICDDEAVVRLGLQKLVRLFGLPIDGIFLAASAEEGLRILREHTVNIVLTDIEMPGMSGLDFLGALTRQWPGVKSIIISGHSNFQYARRAIHIGVQEYVLKPVDETELREALRRCVQACQDMNARSKVLSEGMRMQLERALGTAFTAEMLAALKRGMEDLPAGQDYLYIAAHAGNEALSRLSSLLADAGYWRVALPGTRSLGMIVSADAQRYDPADVLSIAESWSRDEGAYYAPGEWVKDLSQFGETAAQAEARLCGRYFHPDERAFFLVKPVEDSLLDIAAALADDLKHRFFDVAVRDAERLVAALEAAGGGVYETVAHVEVQSADAPKAGLLTLVRESRSIEELKQSVRRVLIQCGGQDAPADAITTAINYICAHYSQPITLAQVANLVSMNYSYFSTLFKQRTGMGFSNYLQRERLSHAKELLARPGAKVHEVAREVGFTDEKYFGRVFKRFERQSPGRYRVNR